MQDAHCFIDHTRSMLVCIACSSSLPRHALTHRIRGNSRECEKEPSADGPAVNCDINVQRLLMLVNIDLLILMLLFLCYGSYQ
jgi:hypothetical protein